MQEITEGEEATQTEAPEAQKAHFDVEDAQRKTEEDREDNT